MTAPGTVMTQAPLGAALGAAFPFAQPAELAKFALEAVARGVRGRAGRRQFTLRTPRAQRRNRALEIHWPALGLGLEQARDQVDEARFDAPSERRAYVDGKASVR